MPDLSEYEQTILRKSLYKIGPNITELIRERHKELMDAGLSKNTRYAIIVSLFSNLAINCVEQGATMVDQLGEDTPEAFASRTIAGIRRMVKQSF